MSLNRRQFNASLAAALSAFAARPAFATGTSSTGLSFERFALNRLTFGATDSDEAFMRENGLAGWLARELAKPLNDEALAELLKSARLRIEYEGDKDDNGHSWNGLKEDRPYQYLESEGESLLPLIDFEMGGMSFEERIRPAREVQAASLIRAVHANSQLREVMTQFWHDHFNVNAGKDEHTAAYFPVHDRIMRSNALGNFRTFLGEVVRSPSMLFYLNNEASKASPANENFARELFELHTLGAQNYANDVHDRWFEVPGAKDGLAQAYIDEDVYEAARALTGWSFGDGRWLSDGENAPRTGAFHYIDGWHDPYQKRILGVEFAPNGGPMADGGRLLDIVAFHPGTARHICGKIIRRLLADEPDAALVESAAAVFLEHKDAPDQIAQVVQHIVLSPQFAGTKPQKLRRPFEFLAGYIRMSGGQVTSPQLDFLWALAQCGWSQHECRPPTGHSDHNAHWANTNYLAGLTGVALNAFEEWANTGALAPADILPADVSKTSAAAALLMKRLISEGAAEELASAATVSLDGDAQSVLPEDRDERNQKLRAMLAMAAFHPEFLYR
ncbi:MAG: DUF1800 domain-containing protein [Rhizobiaceae bacterium]